MKYEAREKALKGLMEMLKSQGMSPGKGEAVVVDVKKVSPEMDYEDDISEDTNMTDAEKLKYYEDEYKKKEEMKEKEMAAMSDEEKLACYEKMYKEEEYEDEMNYDKGGKFARKIKQMKGL